MSFFLDRKMSRSIALFGLILTAVTAAACTEPEDITAAEAENVTREEVVENTDELIGQIVSVRGETKNAIDAVSFTIGSDQLFGGKEILVVNNTGGPMALPDVGDSQVQVTGNVQNLVLAELEALTDFDLDASLYLDYEDQPVIFAQSIALAPDPGEITAEPEKYYDQVIAVKGEVKEILAPGIFSLAEDNLFGGEDLLVINKANGSDLQNDEAVTLTGTLRPYVAAEIEREYGTWDEPLQARIEAEFVEQPIFVADDVYPSAVE